MAKYSKRQYLTLLVISIAQFCNALCISIQAPFYPAEAEKKGATPSQYGFVFGIYELVMFLCCPLYGKFLGSIGVKLVNNTGVFIVSITSILFGFLVKINDVTTFIAFSFAIRIVEATGTSAFTTAAFSIIAKEFPDDVGSTFAALETFFGIGLILGPTIGGMLYELGGFTLPFVTVGCILAAAGILILILLPSQDGTELPNSKGLTSLLSKLPFLLGTFVVFGTAYSIGFVQATLEPHIRSLGLTPFQVGLLFIVSGAVYALFAPVWGRLSDRVLSPRIVMLMGSTFIVIAFIIMGPAPYMPFNMSLTMVIISLVFHGLGMGSCLVGSFSGFHKDSLALGFPDDISTYGLVSGLWTSSFALGAFIGPSAAGLLFDCVGFSWASQTVLGLHGVLLILSCCYLWFDRKSYKSEDTERLISRDIDNNISAYGTIST